MKDRASKRKGNSQRYIYGAIIGILVLLWLYTVCDKLYDFKAFSNSMLTQVFSRPYAIALTYSLPTVEWCAMCLLLFPKLRLAGLYLSALLLLAFTLYVAFAVLGFFPRRPCVCGGLFSGLSWNNHLLLNIFLLSLSAYGIYLFHDQRKEVIGT